MNHHDEEYAEDIEQFNKLFIIPVLQVIATVIAVAVLFLVFA